MRRNVLFDKTSVLGVCLGVLIGSLSMAGATSASEGQAADGADATIEDATATDATTTDSPDAGLPEADDAGFGDGGEAMPGANTQPIEERSDETHPEENGEEEEAGSDAN